MAAAISAGRLGARTAVLERMPRPGKKILVTGNGKCNLTNIQCENVDETLKFFDSLGIYTRTDEEGRIYPYCSQAKDVVYALVNAAETAGVDIVTNCTAEKIEKRNNCFYIKTNNGEFTAKKVLIASGGKAAPQFGTSGDGYILAKSLGHTVSRLAPVLTGIEMEEDLKTIKGVRVKALVKLLKDNVVIEQEAGEVQFNEDGISGICVMNLSRFIKLEDGENFYEGIRRYSVQLDFIPEMDEIQLENMLKRRVEQGFTEPEDILISILPQQLRNYVSNNAGKDCIRNNELCKLAAQIKGFHLNVSGTKGWKTAQCTAGGVRLDEINMNTMESKLVDNLYFAGEVIDYDGPCGGFNLQNAWTTGMIAGKAMTDVL